MPTLPTDNDKPKEKPNVEKYHYFDVNVKIGDKSYWVRLECEENKNVPSGIYGKRSQTPFGTNKNVNQTNNDVKTVHLYNIKEMRMNKALFQDEPEQQSIFEGNNKARGFRKYKGAYMPAENIIEFFKGADESTIVHELIKKDKQILQKKSMTKAILFFYIVIILILLLVPVPEELLLQSILYRKLLFPE